MQIQVTQDIAAPSERVWAIITDLAGWPEVLTGVDEVEILAGGDEFGIGTRWRETRMMFGSKATEEMEVGTLDEGRSYGVVAESRGTRYATSMEVVPTREGASRLTMTFGGEPTSGLAKGRGATRGRLRAGPPRTASQRDRADIAAAAAAREDDSEARPPIET